MRVNFTKAAVHSPVLPRVDKVASLVQQAYLYSKSTPWQNTLLSLRMFSICSTRIHLKKEKKGKKEEKKGIHWKEIRQTKAGIKKSDSDASLTNNNLHLHYVHVHTMCTKQFGTVWCTLWCAHVSISLCETAVFFYTKKKKKKTWNKRCSAIIIYNFLDTETNEKQCTNTHGHDNYCNIAFEASSYYSDVA